VFLEHDRVDQRDEGTRRKSWNSKLPSADPLVEIYAGREIWQTVKARYVSFPNTL
jgi:hypothetical protein